MFGGIFGNGGEFAGINENNVEEFTNVLHNFRIKVEETLDQFNQRAGAINVTFAGEEVRGEVKSYLDSAKYYLVNVVDWIEREEERIRAKAFEQWNQGGEATATNINNEAAAIRSAAANINLD